MSVKLKNLYIASTVDKSSPEKPVCESSSDIEVLTVSRTEAEGWKIDPFVVCITLSRDNAEERNEYWAFVTIEISELNVWDQRPATLRFEGSNLLCEAVADFSSVLTRSDKRQCIDAQMLLHFDLETPEQDSVKITRSIVVKFRDDLISYG